MASAINLIGDLGIIQGKTYNLTVWWQGDVSIWIPRAKIRDNYKSKDGIEKAIFNFLPLTYPVIEESISYTLIPLGLTATQTELLEPTKYQGNEDDLKVGKTLVWDLELESLDGIVVGTTWGYVQVYPEVT
jgi:hypothetical protein